MDVGRGKVAVRLLLDVHLSPKRIGRPLRGRGHDVLCLAEAPELQSLSDVRIVRLALAEDRVVVTCNARHFTVIARQTASTQRHAGMILLWTLDNDEFGAVVRGVTRLLEEVPRQTDWHDRVLTL